MNHLIYTTKKHVTNLGNLMLGFKRFKSFS